MSDRKVNIRIGMYHFFITDKWKFGVSKNFIHAGCPPWEFEIYTFFWYQK